MFSVRFSPDGQHLATAGMDSNIFLWDVYGECENYALLQGHKNAVLEICWNWDGTQVCSSSADKTVGIWDAAVSFHFVKLCLVRKADSETEGSRLFRERNRRFEEERQFGAFLRRRLHLQGIFLY